MMDKTSEQIGIRVTKEFKERMQNQADIEGRTLANLVKKACEDYLKKIEEVKQLINWDQLFLLKPENIQNCDDFV